MKKIQIARLGILLCIFATTLDLSITITSIPYLAVHYNIASSKAVWILNYYQIGMFAAILPAITLSYRYGLKQTFLSGLIIFNIAAVLSFFVQTADQLIALKFLQGLAVAALVSINISLIKLLTPPEALGKALGWNVFMVASGFCLGPIIAAYSIEYFEIHYLFTSYLILTSPLIFVLLHYLPTLQVTAKKIDIWKIGFLFFGFFLICHGLTAAQTFPWLSLLKVILGLAMLVTLYLYDRHAKHRVIEYQVFKIKGFVLSLSIAFIAYGTQTAAFVALPFLFIHLLDKNTLEVGLFMSPWSLVGAIAAPFAGMLADKLSSSFIVLVGNLILALMIFMFSTIDHHLSNLSLLFMLCICGIGFALFNSPNQKNILSRVPQHLSPDASGLLSLARIAGQTLGTIMMSVWFFIFSINMLSELFILLALCFTFAAVLSYIRIRGDRNIFQP